MRRDVSSFVRSMVRRITRKPSGAKTAKQVGIPVLIEALESRQIMSASVSVPISDLSVVTGTTTRTISTANVFKDDAINGTVVEFIFLNINSTPTKVNVELFDSVTVQTVDNFLKYVLADRYDGTFIHRSVPGFVVQGGGFKTSFSPVESFGTVINEAYYSNKRGTIAMAKSPDNPNSATSQWFFNVADNAGTSPNGLDFQNGGFTVFGRVLGNGMATIDAINAVPTYNASGPYTNLPLANYTFGNSIQPNNLVTISDIKIRQEVVPSAVSSSNNNLVTASFDADGNVKLNFVAGAKGNATITVTATSADGTTTSDTFVVAVGDSGSNPTANPGNINIDFARPTNITEKLFALTSGGVRDSLRILTQPTHGNLVFNADTNQIFYVPDAGYLGDDSFEFTIRNSAGFQSNTAKVTLKNTAVVTLGPGSSDIRELSYTNSAGKSFNIKYQSGPTMQLRFTGTPTGLTVYNNNVAVLNGSNLSVELLSLFEATSTTSVSSNNPGTVSATLNSAGALLGFTTDVYGTATISITGVTPTGSKTGQYVVTVLNNSPPVVTNGAITADFNRSTNITAQMFALMSDPDGTVNKSTFQVVQQPNKGRVYFDSATQQIVYQPAAGFTGTETFTYSVLDNNNTISNVGTITCTVAPTVTLSSETGGIRQMVFSNKDGTEFIVSLKGNGKVKLTFTGSLTSLSVSGQMGLLQGTTLVISAMAITDTDSASIVSVSTRGGPGTGVAITGVTVASDLGAFLAPSVTIGASGFIAASGADIGTLRLMDVVTDADVTLPGTNPGMNVIVRNIGNNVDISIASLANSFRAKAWNSGNLNALGLNSLAITGTATVSGAAGVKVTTGNASQTMRSVMFAGGLGTGGGTLIAGSVTQMLIGGNVVSGNVVSVGQNLNNLTITGTVAGTLTVTGSADTIKVMGNMTQAAVNIGTAGSILVGGNITDSAIKLTVGIQRLLADQMVNSSLLAAVSTVSGTDALPGAAANFTGQAGYIGFVGLGMGSGAASFQDSRIAGKVVDSLRLGIVKTSNAGEGFGLAATAISGTVRLTVVEDSKYATVKNATTQAMVVSQLSTQGVTARDLVIKVVS